MLEESLGGIKYWQFRSLKKFEEINHFVSGRIGGVSQGDLGELNLSFKVGDEPSNVLENRRRLALVLGIKPDALFFPSQTHSNNVKAVNENTTDKDTFDTDALITNLPGLCICVMSADCVPILLHDPVTRSIGAVHAGWRGTVGKILTRTIKEMNKIYGTDPADLILGIGPSISHEVYEVGEEVINAAIDSFGAREDILVMKDHGNKGYFNLWEANKVQLLELGVQPEHIEISGICTFKRATDFFSARKSSNKTIRFAGGIILRD